MSRPLNRIRQKIFPYGWKSLFVLYVFATILLLGILVYRNYGVSADEPALRKFGGDVFAYLFSHGPLPQEQDWAFYNPIVQVVLRGLESTTGVTDGAEIWFLRHLVTFFLFFGTIVAFYAVAKRRFGDWKLPLLGSVMFLLSPRLFAHGFYNPKDIPALFFFTMSAWTMLRLLEKKSAARIVAHALATALLISVRVFGLLVPALTLLLLWTKDGERAKRRTAVTVEYLLGTTVALVLVWPLLWHDPVRGLLGAFVNNTSRSGGGLYFGQPLSGAGVPWHYLFTWMGITTPVMYSLFFLIGFVVLWVRMLRRPACLLTDHPVSALALLWFSLPVLALIALHIGIFDEWRHVLFLYPAFLLIALEGVQWIFLAFKKLPAHLRSLRWLTPGVLAVQLLSTGLWMVRNHPYEYAYFSIPTHFIAGKFDLDYWGLSYRAGLEWVLANDKRDRINVFVADRVGKAGADTLPLAEWNRLYFVDAKNADYVLDTFGDTVYRDSFPPEKEVHAIAVDGLTILGIERGPDTSARYEQPTS